MPWKNQHYEQNSWGDRRHAAVQQEELFHYFSILTKWINCGICRRKCIGSYLIQRPLIQAMFPLSRINVSVTKIFVHYSYKVMGNHSQAGDVSEEAYSFW